MSSGFKSLLFEQFARIGKALGSPHRLEMLELLAQRERTVEEMASLTTLSLANASQHLQQLRSAGLVTSRKEGLYVHYRLAGVDVLDLLITVQRIAEVHLSDIDRLIEKYLSSKDELEPVSREELLRRAREGGVTVLDVRPAEEYAAGHVAGAINIPLRDLEDHLHVFDHSHEIVAYCRGAYCVLAFEAVAKLRALGFTARRLEGGFPEWQRAALPVAQA